MTESQAGLARRQSQRPRTNKIDVEVEWNVFEEHEQSTRQT